mmetsp:Transcript_14202/g.43574  ORF Transcript_14202/g.43574 Transcript_14202/m.43574 type:complete len:420 (+) Transcript_14202:1502-2761(+)
MCACPPRPPHAVYVVLVVVWHLVVDDTHKILDVKSARSNRCGYEQRDVTRLEICDCRVPVVLPHPTVQRRARQLLSEQLAEKRVTCLLGVDEDEQLTVVIVSPQQLAQPGQLGLLGEHLDMLLDRVGDDRDTTRDNLHRLGEDAACEFLDGGGESGGEKHRLPVGPRVGHDPVDLRREAHIEHAVCLVEHYVGDAPQVGHTARIGGEHVDHSSGRAHHHFGATLEFGNLLLDRRAAIDGDNADAGCPAELVHLAVHLHRQLARRNHDERDRPIAVCERRLIEHVPQHGECVAHRLARSCLCDGDDIAPLHDSGQCLRLNGERGIVTCALDHGKHSVREAALRPLSDRLRHALSTHAQLVHRESRSRHFLVGHPLNLGHLDIEGLAEGRVGNLRVVDAWQLFFSSARALCTRSNTTARIV